jgi:hypothetical protein
VSHLTWLHLRAAYILTTARAVGERTGPVSAKPPPVADETKAAIAASSNNPTTTQDLGQHAPNGKAEGAQTEQGAKLAKSEKECRCTRLWSEGIQLWVLIGSA